MKQVAELTHNRYDLTYILPDSRQTKTILLIRDEKQKELFEIFNKISECYTLKTRKTGKMPFMNTLFIELFNI